MKKKICIIVEYMYCGGTEKSLLSLLPFFNRDWYEITILLMKKKGDLLKELPNDIEICEGDIVETTRALNHIVGVVTMIKGCWYIQDGKNSYYRLIPRFGTAENKVIGNIYENKNLLEED